MFFRIWRSRVAIAIATGVTVIAVGAAVAVATSSTAAGGSFRVFGVSSGTGSGGSVLVTGAIGDHGRSQNKGHYVKLKLSKGTLTLNKTKLDKALTKAFNHAKLNSATCSLSAAASGTLPIVKGTGLYAKASGSAHVTVAFGFILPRKAGKCNTSKRAKPVASRQIVFGTGNVSF